MRKYLIFKILILLFLTTQINAQENYFFEAKELFEKEKYKESKFLFQRSIVFNPKDHLSYLYLAKIFKEEGNKKEEEKNLNTTILLDSTNEEAIYMLIEIELEKSNFSKVSELREKFLLICVELCENKLIITEKIKNLEPKNELKQ